MELLVVEDDERVGDSLVRALGAQGYRVGWVRSGRDALRSVDADTDLVILDLGLPDVDGVDVCRELRAREPELQILMLTARRDEIDVVVGLDAGADDYLVKPFALAELLARIRACDRRRRTRDVIEVGALVIDVAARTVTRRGESIELTVKEFDLLVELARAEGAVVRRTDLIADVWDEHWYGPTKTIDTHIWSLRRKLDEPGRESWITTVRGVGYRLAEP